MKFHTAARRAAGALLLTLVSFGAFAADNAEAYQRVEKLLGNLQSLEAQFKQTLTDSKGQVTDQSSGMLAIRRPNRFRWDYKEPHEQLIVSDGSRIWLYDPDLEQVTVRRLTDSLSATPAMLLSGEGKLADNFTVTKTSQDTMAQWVMMEPKRNDTDFKWVRLGFSGEVLKFMQLADKLGQITTLEFSDVEKNAPLDPSRFTFKVPPGADVIGDASDAAAPGKP
ncbi:outer membrane lipoprotein carrier protein [Povalibacter uvarum]|uniref:Outer-membrane lipoprotein carrier protein n=1 Tax=Povalibacter uvarum TaxID=732238 RepID=A0A841HJH0_9GAMM|nr:outer membrane lipoprotein chaperone LolA [Povalibacter uvarum]MBB6092302.1 outer membrane lipoprotein carrier protein [Povalibacter uvarum]